MVDTLRYLEWFEKANRDLRTSDTMYIAGGVEDIVAFHCQQAVEKYLKGYLILKTGVLTEGHSLIKLIKKCREFDREFNTLVDKSAFLNQFYLESRYPAEDALIVEIEDAEKCLNYAKEIIEFIKVKI